ncbi:MAG: hypothetical protein ABH874_00620 [Methanobacteriota archaeon]
MNPKFRKIEAVGRTSRYLAAWKYANGESYASGVEITTGSDGSFSELVLKDAFSTPVRLTKTDLRIVAELLRQGIIAKEEVGLQPVGQERPSNEHSELRGRD